MAREHILNCPCGRSHLVCGAVCVCVCLCLWGSPPPTALSHFIICSPAPGCSGTSWLLWIHLLLLFSTDNWLEQWNACVPLVFETLYFVYFPEVSFLLLSLSPSLCLTPFHPSISPLLPLCGLPWPCVASPPRPLTLHPWSIWEGFTWKWQIWLATSVCVTQRLTPFSRFSRGAQLPF